LSGAFENVTFNIPNPEVIESFDMTLPFANQNNADLIINTDPDADRIGVMVNQNGSWHFLTGNEIGIILTKYAIAKYKATGRLNNKSVLIKTDVTTSLIQKIGQEDNVRCIGDLLVGFKYIADEMNKVQEDGTIDDFIIGTEESHGFLVGNYARDKDGACAAVWIAEHAAELKKQNKTLLEDLDEIYSKYGYCHNYLTEIRLLGAKGMDKIAQIMDHLRNKRIESFGDFIVKDRLDRWQGDPQPHLSPTDTSARNILIYYLADTPDTTGIRVTVRPSGTEPKIKMYFEIFGKPFDLQNINDEKQKIVALREILERAFMYYCYKVIDVQFPERGFLLFWQLPLNDKLRYFDIEEDIVNLEEISDRTERVEKLHELLVFLGANPLEKINNAFKAKYEKGVLEYLGIE
jgi:phosphomannomutase